jgi:hypothetical protein
MKAYNISRLFGIIILTLLSFSCSSDLDFNQVNDLKLEPVFIANLSYFDVPANDFVDNGVEQYVSYDVQNFNYFREKFFRDNLKRADFDFEITNTINRSYSLDLNFLNQNDQTVYTIPFDIPASTGTPVIIKKIEIFENATLDLLKTTKRMEFVIIMARGPVLSENSPGSLKLRSSATVYLLVE